MLLFSQSICAAVEKMLLANRHGRTLVTLPSYGASYMLDIAKQLTILAYKYSAHLTLKIAFKTMQSWTSDERKIARDNYWGDTRGNLTYYRNEISADRNRLVVLCGADKITDTAGLEDFTFCDEAFLWSRHGKKLFSDWLESRFQAVNQPLPSDKVPMAKVYDVLDTLRLIPSGGLLKISDWLGGMDMSDIRNGTELLRAMLVNLDPFSLPNCIGFSKSNCRGKSFMQYAKASFPFFDYSSLMTFKLREKASNAVDIAIDNLKQENNSLLEFHNNILELCPGYKNGIEYLESLLKYINDEDDTERKKIFKCDFIFLHDKILRCRHETINRKSNSIKKLHGSLIDILLTAIWNTLYKCAANDVSTSTPICIRIYGESYNFNSETGGSKGLATEICNEAKIQLHHLIDGVDDLLKQYLHDENGLTVTCNLFPIEPPKHGKKTPSLVFRVEVAKGLDDNALLVSKYAWIIPEKNSDQLDAELIRRAASLCNGGTTLLPVYRLPYYEELLLAPDGNETCEILRHCLRDSSDDSFAENLLMSGIGGASTDPLMRQLTHLAKTYAHFLEHAAATSLIHALFSKDKFGGSPWRTLREAYEEALRTGKDYVRSDTTNLGPLLMRAFLLTMPPTPAQGTNWRVSGYEDSAIVTVLHPALLEQLQARIVFLCAGFKHIFHQSSGSKSGFAARKLQRYLSMSSTHAPLCTMLRTSAQTLTSELRGEGNVHKIGHVERHHTDTLSTRLHNDGNLLQEELSDSDLYAESNESLLLTNLLWQYYQLRPHAADGISLAIFRNKSIQPIISGLHHFLRKLTNNADYSLAKHATPYDVRLLFFSNSSDAAELRVWLSHWQSRWETARDGDSQSTNSCYRYCRVSVAHQLAHDCREMEELVHPAILDVDIALLYGLLDNRDTVCSFKEISSFDVTGSELKFPILEKKYCISRCDSEDLTRSRILSLRQFSISTLHADLLAALRQTPLSESSIVISTGKFQYWRNTIDLLHKAADWVICVDPAMDEALIRDSANNSYRDIIAFGSGVGNHGEANFTISSEQFSCMDLCNHVAHSIASLYDSSNPDFDTCKSMAENLLHADKLAGMGLVRAASLQDNYIHDYLAYSLTRRLLQEPDALCDTMISLDAYGHWFTSWDGSRPDLLWITGEEEKDGQLHLHARIIECKLASRNSAHVEKAKKQLRDGLTLLEPLFRPRGDNDLDDERPDRRFWWHQLHRVITSNLYAEQGAEARHLTVLLEQLVEGKYAIDWEALLLTYWTDDDTPDAHWVDKWDISGIPARRCVIGRPLQVSLALQDPSSQFWEEVKAKAVDLDDECACTETDNTSTGVKTSGTESSSEGGYKSDPVVEDDDDGEEEKPSWEQDYLPPNELDTTPAPVVFPASGQDKLDMTHDTDTTRLDLAAKDTNIPDGQSTVAQQETPDIQEIKVITEHYSIPDQILFGRGNGGKSIYWPFESATNRHLIIFGSSGNGKTYAIQCLLAELARKHINTMVLDYSQSFTRDQIQPLIAHYFPVDAQHYVVKQPLPFNPFTRQKILSLDTDEQPYLVAGRVTDIFHKAFRLGQQQINALSEAIIACLDNSTSTTLCDVDARLDLFRQEGTFSKNTLETLQSHLRRFSRANPFIDPQDNTGWDTLYNRSPACNHVFQLEAIAPTYATGIIEFVLWDLFFYAQRSGNTKTPRVIVLDEIQNLRLNDGSPVDKILREGRKFGIALIAATQSFSGVKDGLSTLNQAAYKLYFKPASNELADCARQLYDTDPSYTVQQWRNHLASLKLGECFVAGPETGSGHAINFVKITSMEDRHFGN